MRDTGERSIYGEQGAVREPSSGKGRYDLISPFFLDRLAKWMELGAVKYSDRNWEKGGIPFSRFLDSAERHLAHFKMGDKVEDNLAGVMFNIMAIMHFQELGIEDYNDLPNYRKKEGAETDK